jgi:hypothetical protein
MRIRLNLDRLSVSEKVAKAQQIINALTANPGFASPSPPLTQITLAFFNRPRCGVVG